MGHFVFTLSFPDATGASRMAYHFTTAFRRRAHEVTVVHGGEEAFSRSILPEMREHGVKTVEMKGLAYPISPWLAGSLASFLKAEHASAVIGIQQRDRSIALRAGNKAGVPGFISAQNRHVFWGRWPIKQFKEYYYARTLRQFARLVICTSPLVRDEVVERFGVKADATCVLPNGIETSEIKPITASERERVRAEFGVGPSELMLVNVGRIDIQKGQDVLLDAMALARTKTHFKMICIGGVTEGAQIKQMRQFEAKLHRLIEQHGLQNRVVMAGWRKDVNAILQASDGYVHSARWEGFPLSVVEAMAAEKPCVWTNCSGRPEGFVDEVHGWLVPTDDAPSLGAAIDKIVALSEDKRAEMGRACRALAKEKFEARDIGDRFVNLIEAAI